MAGQYERAAATDRDDPPVVRVIALDLLRRHDEVRALIGEQLERRLPPVLALFFRAIEHVLADRHDEALAAADRALRQWTVRDPCGTYYLARTLALIGHGEAMATLRRSVERGFHPYTFFARDPWLDRLRAEAGFREILRIAEVGYHDAAAAFAAAGGERILGSVPRD
jgi:hypothetical protein